MTTDELEIERKLLPTSFKDVVEALGLGIPTCFIQQAYIVNEPDASVRIRTQDYFGPGGKLKAIVCIKKSTGDTSLVRTEEEFEMDYDLADTLLKAMPEEQVIIKNRYCVDGYDVDEFGGALQGLMLVEREFKSVDAANSFVLPSWVSEDVTNDPTYINANLIGRRYKDGSII